MNLAHEKAEGRPASHTALAHLSLFALVITLPLLLLLGLLLFQQVSEERQQIENRISQARDVLASNLDRDLDRDVTILRTLATSQALQRQDWVAFYGQAKAALQGRAYLVLVDVQGRQLVNTYVPFGKQPALTGDPETLARIARSKAPVVSNLFVSLVVKKPVFNVSIPVMQDGAVRYVLSLGLLSKDLQALLASQRLGPDWVATIWDAHGVILARSPENERFIGTLLPRNLRQHAGLVRTTNLDGTDVFHATATSKMSGWGIGVNFPYALISAQIRHSLLLWAACAAVAIAVASISGLFLAHRIATSLGLASRAAAAFGRGETFPITGSRLKESDAFLATLKDAQEQLSKAQSHQEFLMRELQHRTQNLFAVMQAVVSRSLNEGQTGAQAKMLITGRLQALARTHSILAGAAWEGAPLAEIFKREFGADVAGAIQIEDCDILLNADAASQFSLIIHELTTNALKYGALSLPGGRVTITGKVKPLNGASEFSLLWCESGGPLVTKPTRKGFGSVILSDAARQFGMEVTLDYDPQGLRYKLCVPLRKIVPRAAPQGGVIHGETILAPKLAARGHEGHAGA